MATYEFRCKVCDERFEVQRPMSESSGTASCPSGHTDTVKLLSSFASVGAATGSAADAGPAPGGSCCGGGGCACHPG